MAVLVIPISAGMIALALPIMQVAAFGHAQRAGGVELLSAGLATFAVGLFTYSAFLLFVRAYYALGNGRTPAVAALFASIVGIAITVGAGVVVHGAAVVAVIGIGHSIAYAFGALVLGIGLARETKHSVYPGALVKTVAIAAPLGLAAWWIERTIAPSGRVATILVLAGITAVLGAVYVGAIRLVGGMPERPPHATGAPDEPDVVDLDPVDVGSEELT